MSALPTRADYVAGLRAIADLVEATDLPLPAYRLTLSGNITVWTDYARDETASLAAVEHAARVLGVDATRSDSSTDRHHTVDRSFGPIDLHFSHLTPTTSRAGDTETAPEVPAVATAQPGSQALLGAGEVAGPDGRSGPATAAPDSEWEQVHRALVQVSGQGRRWVRASDVAVAVQAVMSTHVVTRRLEALHSGGRVDMSTDRAVTGMRGTGWRPRVAELEG